ncbi:unnamed protein product [Prorocentrum cordatum]|uniref:Uncharacterized protein n=1 Tax=Prorocentrum cordatum TaxID=2364126 RepID=A0ABN9WXX9_9DINO|nr:unnamed protein product [Polarella glacialis]
MAEAAAAEGVAEQDDGDGDVLIEEVERGDPVGAAAKAEAEDADPGGDGADGDPEIPASGKDQTDEEIDRIEKEKKGMSADEKLDRSFVWKAFNAEDEWLEPAVTKGQERKASEWHYSAYPTCAKLGPRYYPNLKHTEQHQKAAKDICESSFTNLALVQVINTQWQDQASLWENPPAPSKSRAMAARTVAPNMLEQDGKGVGKGNVPGAAAVDIEGPEAELKEHASGVETFLASAGWAKLHQFIEAVATQVGVPLPRDAPLPFLPAMRPLAGLEKLSAVAASSAPRSCPISLSLSRGGAQSGERAIETFSCSGCKHAGKKQSKAHRALVALVREFGRVAGAVDAARSWAQVRGDGLHRIGIKIRAFVAFDCCVARLPPLVKLASCSDDLEVPISGADLPRAARLAVSAINEIYVVSSVMTARACEAGYWRPSRGPLSRAASSVRRAVRRVVSWAQRLDHWGNVVDVAQTPPRVLIDFRSEGLRREAELRFAEKLGHPAGARAAFDLVRNSMRMRAWRRTGQGHCPLISRARAMRSGRRRARVMLEILLKGSVSGVDLAAPCVARCISAPVPRTGCRPPDSLALDCKAVNCQTHGPEVFKSRFRETFGVDPPGQGFAAWWFSLLADPDVAAGASAPEGLVEEGLVAAEALGGPAELLPGYDVSAGSGAPARRACRQLLSQVWTRGVAAGHRPADEFRASLAAGARHFGMEARARAAWAAAEPGVYAPAAAEVRRLVESLVHRGRPRFRSSCWTCGSSSSCARPPSPRTCSPPRRASRPPARPRSSWPPAECRPAAGAPACAWRCPAWPGAPPAGPGSSGRSITSAGQRQGRIP